jgi:hypothetical protein
MSFLWMTARLVWLEGQYVFRGQKSIKLHDYERWGANSGGVQTGHIPDRTDRAHS